MFCITGIFKCFTPHEDARRDATRHATPRHAAPVRQLYASLSWFFFSLSFLTSLPPAFLLLFPFFLSFLPLFPCFVFSSLLSTDNPPKCARQLRASPGSREGETITREGKRKKKRNINFEYFRLDRRALGGDKVPNFRNSFLFFLFVLFTVPCALLQSIFAWILHSWISQLPAQIINFRSHEFFCSVASPLLLG